MIAKTTPAFIFVLSATVLLGTAASAQTNSNIVSFGVSAQRSLVVPIACRRVDDPKWIAWYNARNGKYENGSTIPYAPPFKEICDSSSSSSGSSNRCVNGYWTPPDCEGRRYRCGTVC